MIHQQKEQFHRNALQLERMPLAAEFVTGGIQLKIAEFYFGCTHHVRTVSPITHRNSHHKLNRSKSLRLHEKSSFLKDPSIAPDRSGRHHLARPDCGFTRRLRRME